SPGGVMLAHCVTPDFVGMDFSFRDYFKGALSSVPERGAPEVYVSRLYHSKSQGFYKLSLARAIREEGDRGRVIGVIANSLATSRTMGLPEIQNSRFKVVLVGRWDSHPAPDEHKSTSEFLIVVHPR